MPIYCWFDRFLCSRVEIFRWVFSKWHSEINWPLGPTRIGEGGTGYYRNLITGFYRKIIPFISKFTTLPKRYFLDCFIDLAYPPLNSAKLSCPSEVTLSRVFGCINRIFFANFSFESKFMNIFNRLYLVLLIKGSHTKDNSNGREAYYFDQKLLWPPVRNFLSYTNHLGILKVSQILIVRTIF